MESASNYYDYSGLDLEALSAPMSGFARWFVAGALVLGGLEIVGAPVAACLAADPFVPLSHVYALFGLAHAAFLAAWLATGAACRAPRRAGRRRARFGHVLSG